MIKVWRSITDQLWWRQHLLGTNVHPASRAIILCYLPMYESILHPQLAFHHSQGPNEQAPRQVRLICLFLKDERNLSNEFRRSAGSISPLTSNSSKLPTTRPFLIFLQLSQIFKGLFPRDSCERQSINIRLDNYNWDVMIVQYRLDGAMSLLSPKV